MLRSELCPVTTADVLSGLKQPLCEMGYSFTLEGNFRRLKRIMAKFNKPVTEHFDPEFTDFTPATAFTFLSEAVTAMSSRQMSFGFINSVV